MKRTRLLFALLAAVLAAAPLSSRAAPQEPKEGEPHKKETHDARWFIRNGADSGAKQIPKAAKPTTIDVLGKLSVFFALAKEKRLAPVETTVYTVEGDLVRYDKHDDGDFQFVLRDAKTGKTIVCELPDPYEVPKSPFLREIAAARDTFSDTFSDTFKPEEARTTLLPGKVHLRVSGIGYIGRKGGANGKDPMGTPNGVQLHPVTGVTVLGGAAGAKAGG